MLVGVFFATGYFTRMHCIDRDRALAAQRDNQSSLQGTRIASTGLTAVADVDIRPVETLYSVVKSLREHYVEQLTVEEEGKMTYDALRAMLGSLNDPDTRFLEPAQRKLIGDAAYGKFHGIGAVLAIKQTTRPVKPGSKEPPVTDEHLMVVSVLPGSPAAKAGLKTGDEIIAVDSKPVLPFNPYQRVEDLMNDKKLQTMDLGEKKKLFEAEQKRLDDGVEIVDVENQLASDLKKAVEITVAAKAPAKENKVKIEPGEIDLDPVNALRMESGDYGYIKINYLGVTTGEKFADEMKDLETKNAKGLVLDLRGATGGDMKSAEEIAKWFAPGKPLAALLKSRGRRSVVGIPIFASADVWRKPVVVLVDGSTARAPEVLASGLKENGVAQLVGKKTYGDFKDTTVLDLADGSAVMMTTGKYVTIKGVDFSGKGLPVDIQAASDSEQIREAVKLLSAAGSRS